MIASKNNRLRELDFLRGLAIILVLFRHQYLFQFTVRMGWIGVDLFFVLSGFLVSSLLFKEYLEFGSIKPGQFLIRRGFKIYPIYFISYLVYISPLIQTESFSLIGLISDLTFTQNYIHGWGYAYPASWSLAVEEHFYLSLAVIFWISFKKNLIKLKTDNNYSGVSPMDFFIIPILALCLVFRISSNIFFPNQLERNFTMTHLRIDSLLSGVLLSYLYYFRLNYLRKLFSEFKYLLYVIAFLGIIWTPFIDPVPSFFVKTLGFTLLYISFSIILTIFLLHSDINQKLNSIFSKFIVDLISKIGVCSYSIYIVHTFINSSLAEFQINNNIHLNPYLNFMISTVFSILAGMLMTYKIENYFLRIRDKYYPNRVNVQSLRPVPVLIPKNNSIS